MSEKEAKYYTSKKSLRDKKVGNAEQVVHMDMVTNPEVKEKIKSIIKCLRGLDNISGGGTNTNIPHNPDEESRATTYKPVAEPSSYYHFYLQYDDDHLDTEKPKNMDPDHTRKEENLVDDEQLRMTNDKTYKDDHPSKQIQKTCPYSTSNRSTNCMTTDEVYDTNYRKSQIPRRILNTNCRDSRRVTESSSKGKPRKKQTTNYPNKELTEMIKYYRNYQSNVGTDDQSNSKAKHEERLNVNQFKVFKEPSLNFFLPIEHHHHQVSTESSFWSSRNSTSTKLETTIPENFGAPYFCLDGTLLDDVSGHVLSNDIKKFVNLAIQQQHIQYQDEGTAITQSNNHSRLIRKPKC